MIFCTVCPFLGICFASYTLIPSFLFLLFLFYFCFCFLLLLLGVFLAMCFILFYFVLAFAYLLFLLSIVSLVIVMAWFCKPKASICQFCDHSFFILNHIQKLIFLFWESSIKRKNNKIK